MCLLDFGKRYNEAAAQHSNIFCVVFSFMFSLRPNESHSRIDAEDGQVMECSICMEVTPRWKV